MHHTGRLRERERRALCQTFFAISHHSDNSELNSLSFSLVLTLEYPHLPDICIHECTYILEMCMLASGL